MRVSSTFKKYHVRLRKKGGVKALHWELLGPLEIQVWPNLIIEQSNNHYLRISWPFSGCVESLTRRVYKELLFEKGAWVLKIVNPFVLLPDFFVVKRHSHSSMLQFYYRTPVSLQHVPHKIKNLVNFAK